MAKFLEKLFGRRGKASSKGSVTGSPPEQADDPAEVRTTSDEMNVAHAQMVFERYNQEKSAFLREQLTPKKKIVYDLIPLLLHGDAIGLLDADDACQMAPHGVYVYEIAPQTELSFKEAFPKKKLPQFRPRASYDPSLPIKSVSLIGSLGSIAQNTKSDFDYWVCFEERSFSRESYAYFLEKLHEIELWADRFAGAEVHFFPLDLARVRADDFGQVTGESSGSALGKLLKEEFYRTLTMVGGQTPLWWVMPPGVSDEEYNRLAEVISRSTRVDLSRLVDMGNVGAISLGEFYGAAIWQINKTMGSPFKSILKMALLEEYMFNHGSKGLLCTELKQRLFANEAEITRLDPYLLMFERAANYLTEHDRPADLDLLRRSIYMKSGVKIDLADYRRTDLDRKKKIVTDLIRQWGWSHKKIDKLNNFHRLSFREAEKFSQETNAFIVRTYRNVAAELAKQRDQVGGLTISQRDLTVLGRKLFIFYSKRTNKVETVKSVIDTPPTLDGLTLQPHLDRSGRKMWGAYRALLSRDAVATGAAADKLLRNTSELTHILIWLVNSQLYDSGTSINLNSGPGDLGSNCTVPDIQRLLKALMDFFRPYKHGEVDENELLKKPSIARLFLVVNLEEPDDAVQPRTTGLCYQNNWGEVFYKGYDNSMEGMKMARNFVQKHFKYDPLGALSNFKAFLPDRQFKKILAPKLNKYFGMNAVL